MLVKLHIRITVGSEGRPKKYCPLSVGHAKFNRLSSYGIKGIWPIFKTEMFIYQPKVNLDEKILFGCILHLTDPEIRQMLVKGMFGNKNSTFHSGP